MAEAPENDGLSRVERIAEQRRSLPDSPGVYLFYGSDGALLYVGKARSIKKRIAAYMAPERQQSRIARHRTLAV